jgi:hypothetical protein
VFARSNPEGRGLLAKQVKLEDLVIKTVADVLALDKTMLLTAVQSTVFFFKQAQGKK